MGKRLPNTRRRILDAALELFSQKGYDLVSVAEIAGAVGIKAPSLYKHYKSKRHIYEAILAEIDGRYHRHMALRRLDGRAGEKDGPFYAQIGVDELVRFGRDLFLHYLHDEYASKFRRMLTLTQFTNRELGDVFAERYFNAPLAYQQSAFAALAGAGRLAAEDARTMALHYYAPLFLLTNLCDRQPDMETQALQMLENHVRQFVRIYKGSETAIIN